MTGEENKEIVRRLVEEVWNERDPEAIPRYFAPGLRAEITPSS